MKLFGYIIAAAVLAAALACTGCSKKHSAGEADKQGSVTYFFYSGTDAGGNSVLFKYIIGKDKPVPYYTFRNEQIAAMSFAADFKTGYVVTAGSINTGTANPSVNNIKIYFINGDSVGPVSMQKLGNALQLFALRTPENDFRIIKQQIDPLITNYLKQTTFIFNNYGKEVYNNTETYDIAKRGMPVPPEKHIKTSSQDGRLTIFFSGAGGKRLAIRDDVGGRRKLITNINTPLVKAEWSSDNKYLAFSTADTRLPDYKTSLYIYSIADSKMADSLQIALPAVYYITGSYLVCSEIKKGKPVIAVINMDEPKNVKYLSGKL
jgi:hypothetical protein